VDDPHLSQARERLGHVLKERWVLEDVLGVGGMAAVYAARHRNGARAAIKVLHGPLSEDQVVRERFLREAYLANSLDHIGTVHVLDDDADPKLGPFLVMELLDGSSLLELLDAGVTFDVPAVLDIAAQTLDVLSAAHQRRIVHRDLKPANLFLCRDGQVKVLDFGIARVLDASAARLTRTGVPLGTPAYMAPEQARGLGRDADARADIYALGATLFRLLAGRHVHVGRGAEQIAQVATLRAPKLKSVAPQLPEMVCAMIDRALEFEPERRYESAIAMQGDVHALQKDKPPPIASQPLPDPGPVPALPPLAPRKRQQSVGPAGQPKRDEVAEIAESHRQRARELARKPDAFTVHAEGEDDEEEDENMPTLVGSPQDMIVGSRPLALSEANAPKRRPPPGIPKPRRSPSIAGGASPERTASAGEAAWGLAAAQAFARVPNVPVPQRPPSGQFLAQTAQTGVRPLNMMTPSPRIDDRTSDVDLDAPTLARGDANAMLLRIPAPPPSSLEVPPSRPVPKTQVNFTPFSPPSIPPASSQRVDPPPVEIVEEPRNRVSLVLGLLALVILAVLAGLMAAKIK
jgi:eukaryotic-like serine/threonine-protein kinase